MKRYYSFYAIFFLLALLTIFMLTSPLQRCDLDPMKAKNDKTHQASLCQQDFSKDLTEIHLEMKSLFVHKEAASSEQRLIQRLGEIINRLDNKQQASTNEKENQGSTNEKENQASNNETVTRNESVDVCPEEYHKDGRLGYPFYVTQGWHTINCTNAKPIRTVISILVNAVAYPKEDEKHILNVLKGITETYPTVQVRLATQSDEVMEAAKKYKNVDAFKIDEDKLGKVWNNLNRNVSTPYVLVARDVIHFTWLTQLERQIRVISQISNVGAVGGASRNILGHWKASCVQTKLKSFVLEYQEGYYHSKNECMFCDYLQGPFVTKTNLLKFDESLPNEVIFEDWFLRVVEDGNLIMSCPDAMYFTTDYYSSSKRSDKNVWAPLAKKWELNRVLLPQGVKHSFSCKDIGFRCSAHNQLLPICCQEEYADALSFLKNFTDTHNTAFELDSGSALGGVKFNGLIPWDIDGDINFLTSGIHLFGKKETIEHFKKNGYVLTEYQPPKPSVSAGYVRIIFNGFYIEVWGMGAMSNSAYRQSELQDHEMSTKVNIRGTWIYTQYSPGLYARNRYGREILKHSQSWSKLGLPHSFAAYSPGSFAPCERPKHHSCLQNYPGDGNIPFMAT